MKLVDEKKPGYCFDRALTDETPKLAEAFIKFMRLGKNLELQGLAKPVLLDIGERGYKSDQMSKYWNVIQGICEDFNENEIKVSDLKEGPFQIITCYETIEHIQNPLFFMKNIKYHLDPKGCLFLSTPGRPKFLWTTHHFFEMDARHLQKWILTPLDLEIVRKKRVRINRPWWFYFTGFRPLFRFVFDWTNIYEIKMKIEKALV